MSTSLSNLHQDQPDFKNLNEIILSSRQNILRKEIVTNPSQPKVAQSQQNQQKNMKRVTNIFFRENLFQLSKQKEKDSLSKFLGTLKLKKMVTEMLHRLLPRKRFEKFKQQHFKIIDDKSVNSYHFYNLNNNSVEESEEENSTCSQILIARILQLRITQFLKKCLEQIPVFEPSHFLKIIWDIMHILAILSFFIFIPIHLALGVSLDDLMDQNLRTTCTIMLFADILFNFNSGFYEKGICKTDRWSVMENYLRNHFIIDLLANVPLLIQNTNQIEVIAPMELLYFLKVRAFSKIFKKLEENFHFKNNIRQIVELCKVMFNIIFMSHLFACIWILVGRSSDSNINWMVKRGLNDEPWHIQYLNAYYYTQVTMITVGYGDIVPQNSSEQIVSIAIMLFACGVFGYSINMVGQIFQDIFHKDREIKQKLSCINSFMDQKKINFNLQFQIREYLDYYWHEQNEQDADIQSKIINQLSDNLKEQLLLEANKIVLIDSPIFKNNFSELIVSKTVPLIQSISVLPEQIIYRSNDFDDSEIYFIEKGKVEIIMHRQQYNEKTIQSHTLDVLTKGNCFGQFSFFTGLPRECSVRSLEFCKFLIIKRQDFLDLLNQFPKDKETFCFLKDKAQFMKDFQSLDLRCHSCKSFAHQIQNCNYFHLNTNKFKIIKDSQQNIFQDRLKYERCKKLFKFQSLKKLDDVVNLAIKYFQENHEYLQDLSWTKLNDSISQSDEEDEIDEDEFDEEDNDDNNSQDLNNSSTQQNQNNVKPQILENRDSKILNRKSDAISQKKNSFSINLLSPNTELENLQQNSRQSGVVENNSNSTIGEEKTSNKQINNSITKQKKNVPSLNEIAENSSSSDQSQRQEDDNIDIPNMLNLEQQSVKQQGDNQKIKLQVNRNSFQISSTSQNSQEIEFLDLVPQDLEKETQFNLFMNLDDSIIIQDKNNQTNNICQSNWEAKTYEQKDCSKNNQIRNSKIENINRENPLIINATNSNNNFSNNNIPNSPGNNGIPNQSGKKSLTKQRRSVQGSLLVSKENLQSKASKIESTTQINMNSNQNQKKSIQLNKQTSIVLKSDVTSDVQLSPRLGSQKSIKRASCMSNQNAPKKRTSSILQQNLNSFHRGESNPLNQRFSQHYVAIQLIQQQQQQQQLQQQQQNPYQQQLQYQQLQQQYQQLLQQNQTQAQPFQQHTLGQSISLQIPQQKSNSMQIFMENLNNNQKNQQLDVNSSLNQLQFQLYSYDFESIKCYEIYFTEDNINKVIDRFNKYITDLKYKQLTNRFNRGRRTLQNIEQKQISNMTKNITVINKKKQINDYQLEKKFNTEIVDNQIKSVSEFVIDTPIIKDQNLQLGNQSNANHKITSLEKILIKGNNDRQSTIVEPLKEND